MNTLRNNNNLIFQVSKNHILILFLVAVCFFFRIYNYRDGIIFTYDQARDAFRVKSFINEKNLMLLGPETDIPGVHHGVGYYYLLSIPYAISSSPETAVIFMILLHSFGVILIYKFAQVLFNKTETAFIASLIYAVSFELVQYSRWLSNPSLAIITTTASAWVIYEWIKGNKKSLALIGLFLGLNLHFQLFLAYYFLLPIISLIIFKPKISLKYLISSLLLFTLTISPFLISEIKFKGQFLKSFLLFFAKDNAYQNPIKFIELITNRLSNTVYYTLIPLHKTLSLLILFLLIFSIIHIMTKQQTENRNNFRFLLIWLFINFSVFIFSSGAVGTEFSMVGAVIPMIFTASFILQRFYQNKKYKIYAKYIILFIVFLHGYHILTLAQKGSFLFSVQDAFTYGLEKKVLDYTYKESQNLPFSVCTLTVPFAINTTWAYLYSNYGKDNYGYLPYYAGPNQGNYPGSNSLILDKNKPEIRYLIYEPPYGMPDSLIHTFRNLENYISDVVGLEKFGLITVEKRKLKPPDKRGQPEAEYRNILNNNILYSCFN